MGSSSSTEPARHLIGRLGRPHGLQGFLGIYVADEDAAVLQPGSTVYIGDDAHVVRSIRRVDRGHLVAFEGVDDREGAEGIRGLDVFVADRRPLTDDEFWPGDLVGLSVYDREGNEVGRVTDVVSGAGQDRLVVEASEGHFEVPFVHTLVPVVDLEAGRIEIAPIPGLTDVL